MKPRPAARPVQFLTADVACRIAAQFLHQRCGARFVPPTWESKRVREYRIEQRTDPPNTIRLWEEENVVEAIAHAILQRRHCEIITRSHIITYLPIPRLNGFRLTAQVISLGESADFLDAYRISIP